MKTKITKKTGVLIVVWTALWCLPILVAAQDTQEKEIKLNIVKDVNGEKQVVDTTILISDLTSSEELQDLKKLLDSEDFKSLGITLDEMENAYFFDSDALGDEQVWVMSQEVEDDGSGNKKVELTITSGDDADGESTWSISSDDKGYMYFFSDDGDSTVINQSGDNKIIVKSIGDGEGTHTVTISDELEWIDTGSTSIEVESTDDGKVIKVTRENGEVKEYQVDEEGAYIIDEEGNISKVEGDYVNWEDHTGGEGLIWVNVDDDGENSNIVVKRFDGNTSEININNGEKQIVVSDEDVSVDGETQVFVKRFESKKGDRKVMIQSKVIVRKLENSDIKNLEKSGINLEGKSGSLEIDNLSFSPNPNPGRFTLEFATPETGKTDIRIFDTNGKQVYSETLSNFSGIYSKEIDISSEKSGVYFLQIQQGDKASSRKIMLE
ncbi:MAG: T9SS type A sorting domain-containing protein [Bacteroidales bacterium]|nr:T9SS type A sorting domain-containing protein [Bacteroidales bacterium]